ncbi:uncharacterized protein LOC126661372 [Mercurialis annua]|uniref:uncharacterized protein LOC126661372 n=1 Tax=Mercurialis annua TaxID=3986 RepID=UPI00215F84E0|nr:uncharacterized protein LOC126661372 [Mercurialis annua]
MKSVFALAPYFLLLLLAMPINGRKDIGEYWKQVIKDQSMQQLQARHFQTTGKDLARDIQFKQSLDDVTIYHDKNLKADDATIYHNGYLKADDATIYHNGYLKADDATIYHNNNLKADDGTIYHNDNLKADDAMIYHNDNLKADDATIYHNDKSG